MSEYSRALPDRPNVRFLKVEAKRRLAAGEFGTLHEAQLGIAREHGYPSWTALKTAIDTDSRALPHVRWLVERYKSADDPQWTAPEEAELREHIAPRFLERVPGEVLAKQLHQVVERLREELTVDAATTSNLRAEIGGLRIEASAEEEPPNLLRALRMYPIAKIVADTRIAEPTTRASGPAPRRALEVAEQSTGELGLPGLILAGDPEWTVCRGWADLDRREELGPHQRFPAYGIAKVITAVAVTTLIEDLDVRANELLRGIRVENDAVTVRDLLTHTSGVISPELQFAPEAPEFVYHETIPCDERRGEFVPSNGGYAVLGRIIADVTGVPYPDAIRNLVFEPLAMTDSGFPSGWPAGGAVVTGYHLADDGTFEEAERHVSTMAAAGGLWTTAPDLVRFGRSWKTLLTEEKAEEALRPQAGTGPAKVGLGWLVNPASDLYGHSGAGPGAGASLLIRSSTGEVTVAASNRLVPMEPVNARLCRPIA